MFVIAGAFVPPERKRIVQDRIERAIRGCHLTEKQVALTLGVDQNRWDEMKRGFRALDIHRFSILLPEVWQHFTWLSVLEDGMPPSIERSAPMIARLNEEKQKERIA